MAAGTSIISTSRSTTSSTPGSGAELPGAAHEGVGALQHWGGTELQHSPAPVLPPQREAIPVLTLSPTSAQPRSSDLLCGFNEIILEFMLGKSKLPYNRGSMQTSSAVREPELTLLVKLLSAPLF